MTTITGISVPIGSALLPGGAVGDHTVPGGLVPGDTLLSVLQLVDGAPVTATDLTAEFTIAADAAGTVTNTTTDTSGDFLFVVWARAE